MLHKETVGRSALELLKRIMGDPVLGRFVLVGGISSTGRTLELLPMAYDFGAISRSLEAMVKSPRETHHVQWQGIDR